MSRNGSHDRKTVTLGGGSLTNEKTVCKNIFLGPGVTCTPVILALGSQTLVGLNFQAILGYIVKLSQKSQGNKTRKPGP